MNISSIQVIKGNPSEGIAVIPVGALPGEKVELTYGDILRVNVTADYRGPATEVTLYGAIGVRGIGFDEKCPGTAPPFPLDQSADWTPTTLTVDIQITEGIDPGADYDLYCKLLEYPEAGMPEIKDVITITGIPPIFKLLEETIYPYAYIYDGDCEVTTFTATSIPFTPASWVSGKMAAAVEEKVREAGGRIMEMRVYVDEDLLRPWTNWRIEVVTRPETTGVAVSLGPWWLGPAIILALVGIIIIATPWVIKNIMAVFKRNPALEDVKPGWKRETLILTIQDSEEYWERTPTPLETLEGMQEEELREYLDEIAEQEVPPVPDGWLPLILLGGLAVLGIGGIAAAYAMSKPKVSKPKGK